ncbi:MAG: flagella basal body P-ring formation protein FlgA [Erythrobacter sp.]|nr:flagella basal body P-ring formation protein FlgA [Erythrobacter sp.]
MVRRNTLLLAASLAASAAPALAQQAGFADPGAIDAEVAAFTGAAIGSPGGARQPVDRRLRLAQCPAALQLAWQGRAQEMVRVECTAGTPWRIFVPVIAVQGASAGPQAASAQVVVERGQVLNIVVAGRGFSVSQQGEALEEGAIGAWIRVRPEGGRDTVRARIETPQRVVIPVS